MTPTMSSAVCPICLKTYLALAQHLRRGHRVYNDEERKLLLNLATGRVNIRTAPCPVVGCAYQSSRLDRHLRDGHPELSISQLEFEENQVKRIVTLDLLATLRACEPRVAMISMLDMYLIDEDEQALQGVDDVEEDEDEEEVCQKEKCAQNREKIKVLKRAMEKKDRESQIRLKDNWKLTKKEEEVAPDVEPEAGPSTENINIFQGSGRGAQMSKLTLPKSIDFVLDDYQNSFVSDTSTVKQFENALSKASRVRSYLFHIAKGKKDPYNWHFFGDLEGFRSYMILLRNEKKAPTTVKFYLQNILEFCNYLKEVPPKHSRLLSSDLNAVARTVTNALKSMTRMLVIYKLGVKTKKMKRLISMQNLLSCKEQAQVKIPEILEKMENGQCLRYQFYGYFSAFVWCIFGHRPGVLTNMRVAEVEAATEEKLLDTDTGYVITIDEHKSNSAYGGAQIFLSFEEYSWLTRWLAIRADMEPRNDRVIVTAGKGQAKNLVKYMQAAWAEMGLPGKPTFTDMRTAVLSNAKRCFSHNKRKMLADFICHDVRTADDYYAKVLDRSEAREMRQQFEAGMASNQKPQKKKKRRRRQSRGEKETSDETDTSSVHFQESDSSIIEEEAAEMLEEAERVLKETKEAEELDCTPEVHTPPKLRRLMVSLSPLMTANKRQRFRVTQKRKA